MRKALITGITGQDGSYLAELLLDKGYEVHGIVRRVAFENPDQRFKRINQIKDKLILHAGSLESYASLFTIIEEIKPDECYHLAAQSFVSYSFEDSFSTFNTNINGTNFILEAIRRKAPQCRFYFAGSSEMFGKVTEIPQTEHTPFHPRSPYGISKTAGYYLTQNYREAYNLFACSGILFNHESPRRGVEFVTRKITHGAARIRFGFEDTLALGNLNASRDWGHAKDYVEAMWLMLQQDTPRDYVIATGITHTVQEFVAETFRLVDLKWQDYVTLNDTLYRPAEVNILQGDSSLARKILGWQPKTDFAHLVQEMVDNDLDGGISI